MHNNGYLSGGAEPIASVSRKRSFGLTSGRDGPQPKRVSANPSPQTPSTPDYSNYDPHVKQEWSLPNRPGEARGSSGVSDYIDLTISDPPSPDSLAGPINASQYGGARPDPFSELENAFQDSGLRQDPFPELAHAFRDDGGRLAPADAFNQEFMRPDELAQFLITPTPPGGGFAFQQQQREQVAVSGEPRVPSDVPSRSIPYLPGSRPAGLGGESDDDEDYGDLLLSATEAESMEKMLELAEQNGKDFHEDREQTPRIMSSTLKEYQKIGLTWLLKMEDSRNKGGILADEMGLGKTVSSHTLAKRFSM
jgi:hypothetical protein